MPEHFGYTNTIYGTQSTVNGAAHNYALSPPTSGTWRYSGPDTYFVVDENTGASVFNGDPTNEVVSTNERIGGRWQQTTEIGGIDRQIIYDYTFTVSDGTTTWRVTAIDVDLNNDNDLDDAGEDGYFLIFPDGMPPADTNLSIGGIVDNEDFIPHADLGGSVVCFAHGTLITTTERSVPVEDLAIGDLVETRDGGHRPIAWIGKTTVRAEGDLAPIVITKGTLGNSRDLVVSPQHAILLDDWRAELFFGQEEVLVRAVDLLRHDGVYRKTGGVVTYYHILFDAHHLVCSEGIWSESLFPGEMTLQTVNEAARAEIFELFPDLSTYGPKAAPCLRSYEASCLYAA
ncbi:Hint domain-containing protein [Sulfitobacter sp. F26204]|uniref:Hint domain-containing protein n=1 Tax=Sulfitobacter sp. F26204 TaxID=2996014 RepID=UPI00225E4DAA|nr:Hint domain-containing protein [Sulfitobacter sp. F26204]MCX7559459.1 Hint domain-containing protein [Sulfitobacter sp. F26204]